MDKAPSSTDIAWGAPHEAHAFQRISEGRYRLEVPEYQTTFEVDRLWRDRHELCGEIVVSCHLKGARTYGGTLFSGNVNLSSAYRRRDVRTHLTDRSQTGTRVDWDGLLEELAARIVKGERAGHPAALLHTFDRPTLDDTFNLEGLILPRHHPTILFGDGGTGKSLIQLYVAGWLAQQGIPTLYADWELEGPDHRDRLERLFGAAMPPVFYYRCYRPLIHEVDGIKRQIADHRIQYAVVCDSVGYATDGAPESAEAAMGYFRAVREFGVGSLHSAHVTKPSHDGSSKVQDPGKPFGSVFWHNSARSTWFIKRPSEASDEDSSIVLALFNKKNNLGRRHPALGLQIDFNAGRTALRRVDLADVQEFAGSLPVWQRMKHALRSGPRTLADLAEELGAMDDDARKKLIENMEREVRRKKVGGRAMFERVTRGAPAGIHRIALASDRQDVA